MYSCTLPSCANIECQHVHSNTKDMAWCWGSLWAANPLDFSEPLLIYWELEGKPLFKTHIHTGAWCKRLYIPNASCLLRKSHDDVSVSAAALSEENRGFSGHRHSVAEGSEFLFVCLFLLFFLLLHLQQWKMRLPLYCWIDWMSAQRTGCCCVCVCVGV